MQDDSPYRDATAAILRQRDNLVALRLREADAIPGQYERARAAQIARTWAGIVGSVGMSIVFVAGIAMWACDTQFEPTLAYALYGVWGATAIAWLAGHATLRWRPLARELRQRQRATEDPLGDLKRMEEPMRVQMKQALERHAERALVWPAVAGALAVPLFVHWLTFVVFRIEFHDWLLLSTIIVPHAHFGFAYGMRKLAKTITANPRDRDGAHSGMLSAITIATGAACIPGLVLLAIPPLLVAVTGLAVAPLLKTLLQRVALGERHLFV